MAEASTTGQAHPALQPSILQQGIFLNTTPAPFEPCAQLSRVAKDVPHMSPSPPSGSRREHSDLVPMLARVTCEQVIDKLTERITERLRDELRVELQVVGTWRWLELVGWLVGWGWQ